MRSVCRPSQSTSLSQTSLHVGWQPASSEANRTPARAERRGRRAGSGEVLDGRTVAIVEVVTAGLLDAVHPEGGLLLVLERDLVGAGRVLVGVVVPDVPVPREGLLAVRDAVPRHLVVRRAGDLQVALGRPVRVLPVAEDL